MEQGSASGGTMSHHVDFHILTGTAEYPWNMVPWGHTIFTYKKQEVVGLFIMRPERSKNFMV